MKHNTDETLVLRTLVDTLIGKNFVISVFDGGEWTVHRSSDADVVMNALRTVDEDILYVRNPLVSYMRGQIQLVYGNAPYEVICDHSTILDGVLDSVFTLCDELEAAAHAR